MVKGQDIHVTIEKKNNRKQRLMKINKAWNTKRTNEGETFSML